MLNNLLTKVQKFFMNEEKVLAEENKKTDSEVQSDNVQSRENTASEEISDSKDSESKPAPALEEVKEEVIKVLKTCYDPEIPVDIWELGLVYDIKIAENRDVLIVMTLTSPSCPVAGILPGEVEQKVKEHPMVND